MTDDSRIDPTDAALITALQRDARLSLNELARLARIGSITTDLVYDVITDRSTPIT